MSRVLEKCRRAGGPAARGVDARVPLRVDGEASAVFEGIKLLQRKKSKIL